MNIDIGTVFAYVIGIIFLFIIGRLFLIPMKIVLKLFYNALLGGVILLIINFAGGFFSFRIAFNILSAFVVGVLGLPGIILLIALKFIFNV